MKNKTQMIFKRIFTARRKRLEPKRMENKGYFLQTTLVVRLSLKQQRKLIEMMTKRLEM